MEKHYEGKTSGARRSKGLKPHAATKLTSAAFSAPFEASAILLCNYDGQTPMNVLYTVSTYY